MPLCRASEGRRTLSVEQAAQLLTAVRNDPLEALWTAGLMLGPRPGELAGLTWADIDLDHGLLHIRQSLKSEQVGGTTVARLGELKTTRSHRSLNMPGPVQDAFQRHFDSVKGAGRLPVGAALVFTNENGKPLDRWTLRRRFTKVTDRAGLDRSWNPYELRHSAASLLCAAGVPAEVVGDILGHDGTRMVATVYRHAVTATVVAAVAPMEAMFAGAAVGD
jgi:integrase